jgi:hypothetical protein
MEAGEFKYWGCGKDAKAQAQPRIFAFNVGACAFVRLNVRDSALFRLGEARIEAQERFGSGKVV